MEVGYQVQEVHNVEALLKSTKVKGKQKLQLNVETF